MKFSLTIPQATIKTAYQDVLKETAADITIKGFRKGKAPLDVVEQNIDKNKLYEHMVSHVLPPAYSAYIKKNNLKPITDPKISIKSATADADWEFELEIAEKPEVDLGKYDDAVKGALAKLTLWTPDKGKADEKELSPEEKENQRLATVFDTLLSTAKVEVPELLVEEEVNRALSQLVNQVNKLGVPIDQYLKSIGKTSEQLREEYQKTATENLKLEFILDAIASDKKLVADQKEVDSFIDEVKDPELKKRLQGDAYQQAAVRVSLTKRKVVNALLNA